MTRTTIRLSKIIASAALATVLASPAFAQTARYSEAPTRMVVQPIRHQHHSPNPAFDVYDTTGHYVGSDPDPHVRDMLRYDNGEHMLD